MVKEQKSHGKMGKVGYLEGGRQRRGMRRGTMGPTWMKTLGYGAHCTL